MCYRYVNWVKLVYFGAFQVPKNGNTKAVFQIHTGDREVDRVVGIFDLFKVCKIT